MPASVLNAKNYWRSVEFIRWFIFFSIAIIGTVGDLISKTLTYQIKELEIIPGILRFNFVLNKGIIWGIASQGSIFFLIIPALAIPLILLIFKYIHLFSGPVRIPDQSNENAPAGFNILITIAFGLIMAGAAGNLYDRFFYKGVRDFIDFYSINWPIFNLADIYISCGVALIIIDVFWNSRTVKTQPANQEIIPVKIEPITGTDSTAAGQTGPNPPEANIPEQNSPEKDGSAVLLKQTAADHNQKIIDAEKDQSTSKSSHDL